MALDKAKLDHTGVGLGQAPKQATYRTTDASAVVQGANYFDELYDQLETGDVIYAEMSDGSSFYTVTVNKTAQTVVLALELPFVAVV